MRRRVHQARAVEMKLEPELACGRGDLPSSSSGQTVPPALLWVFSSATTEVRGVWKLPSSCIVARICSDEMRPWSPRTPCTCKPPFAAAPPSSETTMCAVSSTTTSVARSPRISERDLVSHRRRREVDRLFLPEQLGAAAFELEDGRILAVLLVADLGVRHRLAHRLRRLRLGIRAEIDHGDNLETA